MTDAQFRLRFGPGAEESNNRLSGALNDWLINAGPSAIFRTCENCSHMTHDGEPRCTKFDMIPPVAVILRGCKAHNDDSDIPF